MTELELINKIKQDATAFSEIFSLYYKPIFGYIFRRTGDFDATADIVADTFFKAYIHIKDFNYKGISLKVWLYRIATNEVNMYFRYQRKYHSIFYRISFEDKDLFTNYLHQDKEELQIELQKHQQFLRILESLKTLPDKYQNVISLKYFEDKKNKEIVEILNINEGTLKSLLSRGLKKLRKKCNQF